MRFDKILNNFFEKIMYLGQDVEQGVLAGLGGNLTIGGLGTLGVVSHLN